MAMRWVLLYFYPIAMWVLWPGDVRCLQPQHSRLLKVEDSLQVYRMPDIVVTGSRGLTRAEHAPVRVEIIEPTPSTVAGHATTAELLEESAGIVQQYRVRSGIQLMGLEPAYTLILLNGQPLTGRVAGVLDLRRFPLASIERVEIVKGPMSSLYGSTALGGVINLLTPRPQHGWEGRISVRHTTRAGSELYGALGYGTSNLAVHLSAFARHSQPFELIQDTLQFPYAGFTELALQMATYWHLHPAWEIQADGRLFSSRTHGAFAETFGGRLAVNRGLFQQREWSTSTTVSWTQRRARLRLGVSANQYSEFYDWGTAPSTSTEEDDLQHHLGRLWFQYDLLWNIQYRFTFGSELLCEGVIGTRYPDRPQTQTVALFTQWEGAPYDWLSYALSLRWDRMSPYGGHWSPKAAFLFRPWGQHLLQFRWSVGTGFRAPDFRQLFVRFTNQLEGAGYSLVGARRLGHPLNPEQSLAVDVGLIAPLEGLFQLRPWGRLWALELRFFANWVRNLIEPFYVGRFDGLDLYSYRNVARVATRGFDAIFRGYIEPWPPWEAHIRVAYQFLDAVDLDVLDAIAAGRAGSQDPTSGHFTPLSRSRYGGLWGRSQHTLFTLLHLQYMPTRTALSLRLLHRSRFGDEALDRNGVAVLDPPRRVLDHPDEYVPGFWNLSCWATQSWLPTPTITILVNIGLQNVLNVVNPRFLPHLVGRQWFVNAEFRWKPIAQ
ncbi:MAG: TonB-dependent receptor [Candidatus Kapabacteria bacterium]|nr:TonB-dependent receptor [Candidatus Kapabacteria bacterium]MCS7169291.1 TonB-dependent receptor [Candidatus Kapabacteria bacterium]